MHGVLPTDVLTVTLLFLLVGVYTARTQAGSGMNTTNSSIQVISAVSSLTNGSGMISRTSSIVTITSTVDTSIIAPGTPAISVSSSSTGGAYVTGSGMSYSCSVTPEDIGSGSGSSLAPDCAIQTSSTESTLVMPTPSPYSSQTIFPSSFPSSPPSSSSAPPPTFPTTQPTFPLELTLGVAVGMAGLLLLSLLLLLLCCCCTLKK